VISLARRLALRQEVEEIFADDGEGAADRAGYEDDLRRAGVGSEIAKAAARSLRPCHDCPSPRDAGRQYCEPCRARRRKVTQDAAERKSRKAPRPCAATGCAASVAWRQERCPPHANEHRLEGMRRRTARLYAARHADGVCVLCRRPLGRETGRWRHKVCQARTRGAKT
jgi:hypothetical protein